MDHSVGAVPLDQAGVGLAEVHLHVPQVSASLLVPVAAQEEGAVSLVLLFVAHPVVGVGREETGHHELELRESQVGQHWLTFFLSIFQDPFSEAERLSFLPVSFAFIKDKKNRKKIRKMKSCKERRILAYFYGSVKC